MACSSRDRTRRSLPRWSRQAGVIAIVAIASVGVTACSDDDDDATSEGTVAVDQDFPGDALDAACARLDAGEASNEEGDREATARTLLDELIGLGDTELAVNTLELAVIDRCPEWSEAVTAAIEALDGGS